MSLTLESVNEKVEHNKEDIREIKTEIKELGKLYACFEVLNKTIENLASNTDKSISATNENIKEVADLVKKQSEDFSKYKIDNDRRLAERDKLIEEIKSRPEKEALEQKKFWSREVSKKIFNGIIILLLLGFGLFTLQQNVELKSQIAMINNK